MGVSQFPKITPIAKTMPISNRITGVVQIPSSPTPSDGVPLTRTINGHALSADVNLTAGDVGAVPTSRTINGVDLTVNRSAGDLGLATITQGAKADTAIQTIPEDNMVFIRASGVDSTAVIGKRDKPYNTLTAAYLAANSAAGGAGAYVFDVGAGTFPLTLTEWNDTVSLRINGEGEDVTYVNVSVTGISGPTDGSAPGGDCPSISVYLKGVTLSSAAWGGPSFGGMPPGQAGNISIYGGRCSSANGNVCNFVEVTFISPLSSYFVGMASYQGCNLVIPGAFFTGACFDSGGNYTTSFENQVAGVFQGQADSLSTIANAKTFTGLVQLTGQDLSDPSNAVTLGLGDLRYKMTPLPQYNLWPTDSYGSGGTVSAPNFLMSPGTTAHGYVRMMLYGSSFWSVLRGPGSVSSKNYLDFGKRYRLAFDLTLFKTGTGGRLIVMIGGNHNLFGKNPSSSPAAPNGYDPMLYNNANGAGSSAGGSGGSKGVGLIISGTTLKAYGCQGLAIITDSGAGATVATFTTYSVLIDYIGATGTLNIYINDVLVSTCNGGPSGMTGYTLDSIVIDNYTADGSNYWATEMTNLRYLLTPN